MNDIWKNIIKDLLTALYSIPDCGCGESVDPLQLLRTRICI